MRLGQDLVGGFDITQLKVEAGKVGFDNVVHFFKKHAEIEKEYSKSLLKLLDHAGPAVGKTKKEKTKSAQPGSETEGTTMTKAWDTLRAQVRELATAHAALSDKFQTAVIDPLSEYMRQKSQSNSTLLKEGNKATNELRSAQSAYQKAKDNAEKLRADIEGMQAKLSQSNGPQAANLAAKLQGLTKQEPGCTNAYVTSANKLNATRETYYTQTMPQLLNDLEGNETGREEKFKEAFVAYGQAIEELSPKVQETTRALAEAAQAVDVQADLDEFIKAHTADQYTVEEVPDKIEIIPKKEGLTADQMQAIASKYQQGQDIDSAAAAATSAPAAPAAAPPPPSRGKPAKAANVICVAKALFHYDAVEEAELTFDEGQMMDIVVQHPDGWWEAVINGKKGLVPSSYVEVVP